MTRAQLLVLSVACCGFGLVAIYGSGAAGSFGYAVNIVLAVTLAILTGRDLAVRGIRVPWLVGLSYIAAPLVGLVLYGVLSGRRTTVDQSPTPA